MHGPGTGRRAAFTSTELTVVIVCLAVVAFFVLLPSGPTGKAKARRINCVNNLKIVGLAWRILGGDDFPWRSGPDNLPPCVPTNFTTNPGAIVSPNQGAAAIFALVSNELSTLKNLQCPDDRKRFQLKTNSIAFLMAPAQTAVRDRAISYFIGVSASEDYPGAIMGGDRNLAGSPFSADTNTLPSQVALRIPHATATNLAAMNSAVWTKDIHQRAGNLLLGDGSVQQVSSGRMWEQFRDAATNSGTDLDFIWPAN